jgi:hypothetical protein
VRPHSDKPALARSGSFAAVVDSLLDDGIAVRFRAGGRSMSPAVRDGEIVVVAPVDPARIGIGEIVYSRAGRGPLAHRVIAIDAQPDGSLRFMTCGDAATDCDRPVDARAIRGKVVAVERGSELVSLAIAGGRLGRLALVTALGLRRTLRATAARVLAGALATAGAPR